MRFSGRFWQGQGQETAKTAKNAKNATTIKNLISLYEVGPLMKLAVNRPSHSQFLWVLISYEVHKLGMKKPKLWGFPGGM